jgi:Shwachman-Bodian-Diamond syndrome (SBDS) protein
MGCMYISSSVIFAQAHPDAKQAHHIREKDLDDVLQISNVFMNVSKGEVAKSNDLKKSFGTDDRNTVAREVSREQLSFFPDFFTYNFSSLISTDPQ